MKLRLSIILAGMIAVFGCSHASMPVVGVSCSRSGSGSALLPTTYTDALRSAGAVPLVPAHYLSGEDVNPAWYGESVWNETVEIDPVRDRSDSLLARAALACGKPVLAICRGSQLMNVILGGSLYQDLPSQFSGSVAHSGKTHKIAFEEGSVLAGLYGTDSLTVNSMHHQAVKDPAPGIRITARSADGIVEAWETPQIVAVQFHPEKMLAAGDSVWLPLFKAFVSSTAQR